MHNNCSQISLSILTSDILQSPCRPHPHSQAGPTLPQAALDVLPHLHGRPSRREARQGIRRGRRVGCFPLRNRSRPGPRDGPHPGQCGQPWCYGHGALGPAGGSAREARDYDLYGGAAGQAGAAGRGWRGLCLSDEGHQQYRELDQLQWRLFAPVIENLYHVRGLSFGATLHPSRLLGNYI